MLVSIIIPTYNMGKFVDHAFRSAIMQSFRNIEVIVVDDGSTDGTDNLQESFESLDNTHYIKKENGGPASALNTGIKASTGDFIKWLSADDVLDVYAIRSMLNYILYNHNPKIWQNTIYYTDYNIVNEQGEFISVFKEPQRNKHSLEEKGKELMKYFYGNGSTSLIHRSVFEKVGLFDETLSASEDYEFWLRAVILCGVDIHHIPIISLNYRTHPNQLTKRVGGKFDKDIRQRIENERSKIIAGSRVS